MTSLSDLLGHPLISQATAEEIGTLTAPIIDLPTRRVVAWQIGKGRKALVVDHAQLGGIGAAAAMAGPQAVLRDPQTTEEIETLKGHLSLIGARVLSDAGDVLGTLDDVDIDPDSGQINAVRTSAGDVTADRLRGFGSYALVVSAQ